MTFKEVAHLYIGCMLFDTNPNFYGQKVVFDYTYLSADRHIFDRCTPILRPLSALTQHDADTIGYTDRDEFLEMIDECTPEWRISAADYVYLLSRHFDMFGLIASGQAIDATTLTPNPYKK